MTGSFYTPNQVAGDIVKKALSHWINRSIQQYRIEKQQEKDLDGLKILDDIRILDPAVGDGVFLIECGEHLCSLRKALGDYREEHEIRNDIAKRNLYGVDIQQHVVDKCKITIRKWVSRKGSQSRMHTKINIRQGNSLIGRINGQSRNHESIPSDMRPFNWRNAFPEVFSNKSSGFDIIVGNPPYGNILTDQEKETLRRSLGYDVMSGRTGSWNAAPLFIVRAKELLNQQGVLGFLIPNSILRVGQFTKTREFIRDQLGLWCIIDEGNPFDGVTLEMVSIFCYGNPKSRPQDIEVISHRNGSNRSHVIPRKALQGRIISIYYDSFFAHIKKKGTSNLLTASRGRDIPAVHTSERSIQGYEIPYATKGRSVRRYRFNEDYLIYTNEWFEHDVAMSESYSNEFLVATKNLMYPRCVMKPKGVIHGGGVVRIIPLIDDLDIKAIGLILNSKLVQYVSRRYLTNYSQLTTCLNTGIMEEIPIVLPDDTRPMTYLFDILQEIHSDGKSKGDGALIESFVDALVYSLYVPDVDYLQGQVIDIAWSLLRKSAERCIEMLGHEDILHMLEGIRAIPVIQKIETATAR